MTFLGVLFDTCSMTVSVTEDRLAEIGSLLKEWEHRTHATLREIQSLIGKLQFAAHCVRSGRIFISRMLVTLRGLHVKPYTKIRLSEQFIKDVLWWSRFMHTFNGVSIIPELQWSSPDSIFSVDACLTGCGGTCGTGFFHSGFPQFILDLKLHINALELLTISVAIKLWGHLWKGKRIMIYTDNMTSAVVLKSGRTRDPFLLSCLRENSFVCAQGEFEVRAIHLPGLENRAADALSRWHSHCNKYSELFFNCFASHLELADITVDD